MMDAANDAVSFSEGKQASDLGADRKLSLALVKSIEIIGSRSEGLLRDKDEIT